MSERGPGDDRERLGREPGDVGRSERGNPEAEYERGRADAMERQSHEQARQYPPPGGSHTQQSTGTGWGIAAIIFSVLGILTSLIGLISLILSIPGLILGIVARRRGSRGLGLASIILSVLAIIISIVITVVAGAILMNSPEFQQILQDS